MRQTLPKSPLSPSVESLSTFRSSRGALSVRTLSTTTMTLAASTTFMFGLLASTSAHAACSDNTPSGIASVICSDTDSVGITVSSSDDDKKMVDVITGATVDGDISLSGGSDLVTNNGTITGSVDLDTVEMTAIDRLVNFSQVGSGSGMVVTGTAGRQELENEGLIFGGVSFGDDDDLVINEGEITGVVDLGNADPTGAGDRLISLSGAIGSDGSGVAASTVGQSVILGGSGVQNVSIGSSVWGGVSLGADDDKVALHGLGNINGDVDLGAGDDSFELHSDQASMTGALLGGGGYDSISLAGGSSVSPGTVVGDANAVLAAIPSISDFEALEVDSEGTWTVSSSLATGLDTVITNGTLDLAAGAVLDGAELSISADGTLSGFGGLSFTGTGSNAGLISATLVQGDAGATVFDNTGTIAAGSTVDLGDGADSVTTVGDLQGVLTYGLGDDTHVHSETDGFTGVLSGGAGNDTLQLADGSAIGTVDSANFMAFESLEQTGGAWELTGTHIFANGVTVAGGDLPTGATAHLTLGAGSSVTADISEGTSTSASGGSQIVAINAATLTGNADLGAGDDTFILIDNPTITGTLDGGAGTADSLILQGNGTLSVPVVNVEQATVDGTWATNAGSNYTFTNGLDVSTGTFTHNGAVTGPVTTAAGATLTGAGSIDGDLTLNGLYTGTMSLSPGAATSNIVTLNSTGEIASGASLDLGDGSDTFDHMGLLLGTIDYGAGEDRHIYHFSDPAMELGSIVSGGIDSDSDTLELAGNRDGSTVSGAERTIDWANFTNWDRLEVSGGDFALTGDATLDDGVLISGGALDVDGTVTVPYLPNGSEFVVGPDGTLGGDGTIVGDVSVAGTISPGGVGEIGELNIDGDLDFQPTGNLVLDVQGSPIGVDVLNVTGDVDLEGTLTIAPIDELPDGMTVPVLTAGGNVTGEFDTVASSDPFLNFDVDYSNPNQPVIEISTDFESAATEENLSNVGNYIDLIGQDSTINNDPDFDALRDLLLSYQSDPTALRYALAQISPDLYDQHVSALFERNRDFHATMLSQLARCDVQRRFTEEYVSVCNSRRRANATKANVWSSLSGFNIEREGENDFLDYELKGGSAQMGVDGMLLPNVIVGGSFAAGRTLFSNAIRGEGSTVDYDIGGYAQVGLLEARSTSLDLGVAGSVGVGQNKAFRIMDFMDHSYRADYDTERASIGAVLGLASAQGPLSWGLKATTNLSHVSRPEITETGTGSLGFKIFAQDYSQVDVGGSGELAYRQRLSDEYYFIPKVGAGVTHLVSGEHRTLSGKMLVALDHDAVLVVESKDVPTTYNADLTLELQSRGGMLAYGKASVMSNTESFGGRYEGGIRLEF